MKKYAGRRSIQQIRRQCAERGIKIDMGLYEKGSDYVVVHLPGAAGTVLPLMYSAVNGRFFYAGGGADNFSSDDAKDGEPWFDALLDFFYTPGSYVPVREVAKCK